MLIGVVAFPVDAELENHVFMLEARSACESSLPRGWRETDQPSYPGVLLWMMRPEARIVLTAEAFTHELYCSWPITCRTSHEITSMSAKLACAMRQKLIDQRMRVGPVEAGPRENEEAGLPSVWFEFDDGKHFLRQAVAFGEDRAISLVLSAPTSDGRSRSGPRVRASAPDAPPAHRRGARGDARFGIRRVRGRRRGGKCHACR